jgi:hypothetical protein
MDAPVELRDRFPRRRVLDESIAQVARNAARNVCDRQLWFEYCIKL